MPIIDHALLWKPNNPDNVKIWRYMDFAKYVALLDTGSLYFPRSGKLDDPYEGAITHADVGVMGLLAESIEFTPEQRELGLDKEAYIAAQEHDYE